MHNSPVQCTCENCGQVFTAIPERGHRIMCGDATSAADVKKLLDGKIPHLCITDPPYGVQYDPQWREQLDSIERSTGEVTNDHIVDWTEAYKLFPGDVIYVWHGDSGGVSIDVGQHLRNAGFLIRTRIVWRKEQIVMGRGHYKFQHESMWHAVRKGKQSKWCGDNSQSTVWDIPKLHPNRANGRETEHSAEKPVECMARPIRNHGDVNDAVYDPFSGSFTTMIAAHQLGRASFSMEIDPRYTDVGIERYARLTGTHDGIFLLRGNEQKPYDEIGRA